MPSVQSVVKRTVDPWKQRRLAASVMGGGDAVTAIVGWSWVSMAVSRGKAIALVKRRGIIAVRKLKPILSTR